MGDSRTRTGNIHDESGTACVLESAEQTKPHIMLKGEKSTERPQLAN